MDDDRATRILQMLDDISDVVNSIDDSARVCNSLVELVTDTINVENCSIMLIDPATQTLSIKASRGLAENIVRNYSAKVGEGIAGWVAKHGEPLLIPDIDADSRFGKKRKSDASRYKTSSLLSVPLALRDKTVGVLNVNNKKDGTSFDESDEAVVRVVARFVTIALDKAQMREIVMQKERMDAELNAARRIQKLILPGDLTDPKGVEIVAENIPARKVAGDFYDVIHSPNGVMWVVIGDVCGKGLAAALYMARVVGYFRAVAAYHDSPAKLVTGVNEQLSRESADETFVTASLLMFDAERRTITHTSAGHQAPMLFDPALGEVVEFSNEGGTPLGLLGGQEYEEQSRPFNAGDKVLLYTDGVTEATNARDQLFGDGELRRIMAESDTFGRNLLERIVLAIHRYTGTEEQSDDITMLTLRKPEGLA